MRERPLFRPPYGVPAETPPAPIVTVDAPKTVAVSDSSTPALNREQIEILDHTEHRAASGFYCGGGKEMDALVKAGLMEYAGRKSFVPDPYYRITNRGRVALREAQNQKAHRSDEAQPR